MARVTVEDCLEHVENRFALVHLAAQRTRQLVKGGEALVAQDGDGNKEAVTALREIAAAKITMGHLAGIKAENEKVEAAERAALAQNAKQAREAALARMQTLATHAQSLGDGVEVAADDDDNDDF